MSEKPGFVPENLRNNGKEIILFPQPTFLATIWVKYGDEIGKKVIEEYDSVLGALSSVQNHEIKLVKNGATGFVRNENGLLVPNVSNMGDINGWDNIELRLPLYATENMFPRDMFVNLGDFLFISPDAIEIAQNEQSYTSPLGEGGKVLHAGHSIILTEDIWRDKTLRPQFKILREAGYKFGAVPLVENHERERGGNYFVEDHIDGHITIIEGQDGKNYVLYAKSYAGQSAKTKAQILEACAYTEAEPIEIDDRNQTFLALNLTQFREGTVIVTKGANEVIDVVTSLVGKNKVITTSKPIELIPRYLAGGIHCMTNTCPDWLLKIIKKPPLYTRPQV